MTGLVTQQTQNLMPALPQELQNQLAAHFGTALSSFGGSFKRISIKGSRFHVLDGAQEIYQSATHLDVVILGIAEKNHCAWYAKKYDGSDDAVAPDAVWEMDGEVPANVPASALQKDAEGRNQYAIRRRIVVAAMLPDSAGGLSLYTDGVFVLDINAKSNFGADIVAGNTKAYGFNNYIPALLSTKLYPCALVTRIVFDTSESVPVLRFHPMMNNQGQLTTFNDQQMAAIVQMITDHNVMKLLDYKSVNIGQAQTAAQPQQTTPVQQAVQQTQAQPVAQQSVAQQPVQAAQVVQPQAPVSSVDNNALAGQMTMAVNGFGQPVQQPQQTAPVQQEVQQAQVQPAEGLEAADAKINDLLNRKFG